jgi:hypothetical protein
VPEPKPVPNLKQRLSFTVDELAQLTGLSMCSSYRLAHLIGRRLDKRLLVPAKALDEWLSETPPSRAEAK